MDRPVVIDKTNLETSKFIMLSATVLTLWHVSRLCLSTLVRSTIGEGGHQEFPQMSAAVRSLVDTKLDQTSSPNPDPISTSTPFDDPS